mgnify:CR=1 FL=1
MSFMPFNLLGTIPDVLMGRKPLDALLGNTAAVTGTLAAGPGLLGNNPLTQQNMREEQESGLGPFGTIGWGGATTGVQGMLNNSGGLLGIIDKLERPVDTAMKAADMVKPEDQPLPPPPSILPPTSSPTLGQIVQSNNDTWMKQLEMEQARRDARRKRIGLMGVG